jgi:hypothetical protein
MCRYITFSDSFDFRSLRHHEIDWPHPQLALTVEPPVIQGKSHIVRDVLYICGMVLLDSF